MFGGIVFGQAPITKIEGDPSSFVTYTVQLPDEWLTGLEIGASVSVDGVCQTVTSISDNQVSFDAIEETLRLTTLSHLTVGSQVNIERALKFGDEIGGHLLSGHIIGTGTISRYQENRENLDLTIAVPSDWMRFILEKGFVAIDGASLTVGSVDKTSFTLHLIPETRRLTGLSNKRAGDRVNIELDGQTMTIVKTVEQVLANETALI